MTEPGAARPYMPGYGILPADEGTGLLPWSWAVERLTASHDYWVATTDDDGAPHVMPVWGVWLEDAVWFSSSLRSLRARCIATRPRVAVTTDNALCPVVIKGDAVRKNASADLARFNDTVNAKYGTDYSVDFYDPAQNGVWRVAPVWAFGLEEGDFPGSPTRWTFEPR